MDKLISTMARLFCGIFRISALWVGALLLFFPAFKGMPSGYIPLIAGGLLIGGLMVASRSRPLMLIDTLSQRSFFLVLILIPAVLQTGLIFFFRSAPTFDGLFVYQEAVALLETGQMNPLTYFAPAQIWYYAFFFKLFGASPLVAQLCQVPLACLIPVLVYQIGRQSGSSPAARWAALLTALYPGFLLYVLVTPYYYYLYTILMLVMVLGWLRMHHQEKNLVPSLWAGWAAGWGALTKAVLLVAPIQTLFFLIVTAGTLLRSRRWMAWGLFTLAMIVTISPWVIRNVQTFHAPVIICTSGPLVLYSANNPDSNGLYSPLPDQAKIETPAQMLEHGAWCNEQAKAFIREQPKAFIRLIGLKGLYTWGTETTFVELINKRGDSLGRVDPLLRLTVQTGWAALVFAWVITAFRALRRGAPPTALEIAVGILVLSKFLVYSLYEGGARHHLPAVPLLWVWIWVSAMGGSVTAPTERAD